MRCERPLPPPIARKPRAGVTPEPGSASRDRGVIHGLRAVLAAALVAASCAPVRAEDAPEPWRPVSEAGKFDWVQMTSGEWLKGEIISMYDEVLEFDSEEFEDLVLEWEDIRQIHTARVMSIGLTHRRSATGVLFVDGDKVTVTGEDKQVQEFTREEVITITAGPPKEINYWSMKVFLGLSLSSGNSDVRDASLQANVKRRTIRNRNTMDFIGNQNITDGTTVTNNERLSVGWDRFISDRFFAKPLFAEYYHDPLQNIDARWTLGFGAGYQIIDSPKVDWDVSGGPAYQENRFSNVVLGESDSESTPALVAGTSADWDITKNVEFDALYRFQLVNELSGKYNHHMVLSFETDITRLIDFDVSWIWDRIQEPRPDSDGVIPEQDDFRTTVGLTFDF
jgi:putative salt-induced outer membrane protein YdiY